MECSHDTCHDYLLYNESQCVIYRYISINYNRRLALVHVLVQAIVVQIHIIHLGSLSHKICNSFV